MKHLGIGILAAAALLALTSGACFGELKQLTGSGITVSYPPGMDAQAKKVMSIWQSTVKPSIAVQQQTAAVLSNPEALSKDISEMLSCADKQTQIKTRLESFRDKALALISAFSNVRLVTKGTAVATEGVDAGVVQLRYLKDKDEFTLVIDQKEMRPDKVKKSFFPVIVNADGTIRSESKLSSMALDFLGAGEALAIAPVQDTVSYMIAQQLKIYHPLARWFNEGVSGYVTRQLISKHYPKLNKIAVDLFSVSPRAKELRDKINLTAWPQAAYQNRHKGALDPEIETARSQYSIEVITDLLSKAGAGSLPKIMSELNFSGNPDTDAICAAVKKTTNVDLKPTLLTYVPKDISNGLASGEPAKLAASAQALVDQKKWKEAADALRRALAMTPDDVNARINLAWIERLYGERVDSELQIFLTAALLKQQQYHFSLYKFTIEGNYVSGRLAILMGDLKTAKECLNTVLHYRPNHADAKRAMDEIDKVESALKTGK